MITRNMSMPNVCFYILLDKRRHQTSSFVELRLAHLDRAGRAAIREHCNNESKSNYNAT